MNNTNQRNPRIISGIYKGRKIALPKGLMIRPTSERLREAMFNIIFHNQWFQANKYSLKGLNVLDAFAGSGALGLEALSRGANEVVFLETDKIVKNILISNIKSINENARVSVFSRDATNPGLPPKNKTFSLLFIDPPYYSGLAIKSINAILSSGWLSNNSIVAVEIDSKEEWKIPNQFELLIDRNYGRSRLIFIKCKS